MIFHCMTHALKSVQAYVPVICNTNYILYTPYENIQLLIRD